MGIGAIFWRSGRGAHFGPMEGALIRMRALIRIFMVLEIQAGNILIIF